MGVLAIEVPMLCVDEFSYRSGTGRAIFGIGVMSDAPDSSRRCSTPCKDEHALWTSNFKICSAAATYALACILTGGSPQSLSVLVRRARSLPSSALRPVIVVGSASARGGRPPNKSSAPRADARASARE